MASLLALALPSAARADEGHYLGFAKSSSMTSNTTNVRGERCDWSFESISALWAEALGLTPDLHPHTPQLRSG